MRWQQRQQLELKHRLAFQRVCEPRHAAAVRQVGRCEQTGPVPPASAHSHTGCCDPAVTRLGQPSEYLLFGHGLEPAASQCQRLPFHFPHRAVHFRRQPSILQRVRTHYSVLAHAAPVVVVVTRCSQFCRLASEASNTQHFSFKFTEISHPTSSASAIFMSCLVWNTTRCAVACSHVTKHFV
jgi:hypothetical protein